MGKAKGQAIPQKPASPKKGGWLWAITVFLFLLAGGLGSRPRDVEPLFAGIVLLLRWLH